MQNIDDSTSQEHKKAKIANNPNHSIIIENRKIEKSHSLDNRKLENYCENIQKTHPKHFSALEYHGSGRNIPQNHNKIIDNEKQSKETPQTLKNGTHIEPGSYDIIDSNIKPESDCLHPIIMVKAVSFFSLLYFFFHKII